MDIKRANKRIFEIMSLYLNFTSDFISAEMMEEMTCGADSKVAGEYAYASLLASASGVDIYSSADEKEFFRSYFLPMVKRLEESRYISDPYYKNISISARETGSWELSRDFYKPYEAFVFDEPLFMPDGRVIPQIGYFEKQFFYPALKENSREWMLITPNEIETMSHAVKEARGKVLAYGLGMGYFAYMASIKNEVESVTVVERDANVIRLFEKYILPQFSHPEKVNIVCMDAFDFAACSISALKPDFVFTDLWHDPSDGKELYLKMKEFEKESPESLYMYWIEKTIRYYL